MYNDIHKHNDGGVFAAELAAAVPPVRMVVAGVAALEQSWIVSVFDRARAEFVALYQLGDINASHAMLARELPDGPSVDQLAGNEMNTHVGMK